MWLKYYKEPIILDKSRVYPIEDNTSKYSKPCGFWITDDSEDCWKSWCMSSDFNLEHLTHKHEIKIDESKILFLKSAIEVFEFTKEWGFDYKWSNYVDRVIGWKKLSEKYSGLIITPYQWDCRMPTITSWYYGWDCASGCIWDAMAIESVTLISIDKIEQKMEDAA